MRYAIELGHKTIQAKMIETKDSYHEKMIEIRENVERKNLAFSEKMKAADAIEPMVKEKAKERIKNKTDSDLSDHGIDLKKGKTNDIMADILGMGSGKTYSRARNIWEAGDEEIIKELDENKTTIGAASNKVKMKTQKTKPVQGNKTGGNMVLEHSEQYGLDAEQEVTEEKLDEYESKTNPFPSVKTKSEPGEMRDVLAKMEQIESTLKEQEFELEEYRELHDKLKNLAKKTEEIIEKKQKPKKKSLFTNANKGT